MIRPVLAAGLAAAVLTLSGCGDPCEGLQADLDRMRGEALRDPLRLADEEFREKMADAMAEMDERDCAS